MVNLDRNVFAACMVSEGDADAMVSGLTRSFSTTFEEITRVLDPNPGERLFGMSIVVARGRTVLIADTSVHELPSAEELAEFSSEERRVGKERVGRCRYRWSPYH